jgi:multidrug transporter EmrE-like cation transporter
MSSTIKKINIVTKEEKISKYGVVTGKNIVIIILLATLLTVLELTGQSLLRKFYLFNRDNKTSTYKYLWLPLITWFIYGLCVVLLYIAYYYGNIALIEVFWDTGTTIFIPIIGILFFNEGLTKYGYFGLSLTVIGAVILGLAQSNII